MVKTKGQGSAGAGGAVFVGRERELAQITSALAGRTRLITLIGAGGIGKTRLAEEATQRLHRARRTSIFYVQLARLPKGADEAAVEQSVAAAVLRHGFIGESAWASVLDALSAADTGGRGAHTVLVLDNCEHLLSAAGAIVAELLEAVPGLSILATSREPIGWIDEQLVVVPPLSSTQSQKLFQQCSAAIGYPIIAPEQVMVVTQICQHLHGHPLYIRLAAARMFYEPLSAILQQLSGGTDDMRMSWEHGLRAGAEPRHRTISDVIGWSYGLCSAEEQLLFERLSVFASGFDVNVDDEDSTGNASGTDLEAIEMICADDVEFDGCTPGDGVEGRLAREQIHALLDRLVEKSLVSVEFTHTSVRYSLVESLRLFAQQRLAERAGAEPDRLARRHRRYYRDKIVYAEAHWFSAEEKRLLDWAGGAWPNMMIAIRSSLSVPQEALIGLQICMGLVAARVPFFHGSLTDVRRLIEQSLTVIEEITPPPIKLRLGAMAQVAWLSMCAGRHEQSAQYVQRCGAEFFRDTALLSRWLEQPQIDVGLPAGIDYISGAHLMCVCADPRSLPILARARQKYRDANDLGGEAMSEMLEAFAAGLFGTAQQAYEISRRHLERAEAFAAGWALSWARMMVAIAATRNGRVDEALQMLRMALEYQLSVGDQWGSAWGVHFRIWALARRINDLAVKGDNARDERLALATEIARLDGGIDVHFARIGVDAAKLVPIGAETKRAVEVARGVLGPGPYAIAHEQGSRLEPRNQEVQRLALGTLSFNKMSMDHPARRDTPSNWHVLTEAEQEVALLAAAGWPNSSIGARRGTSTKTVDAQMSSIFQKLTISTRGDIIRFVPEDRRAGVSAERARRPKRTGSARTK
ncbi:helix-turn-helix transcriptional regulator [Nocardia sp. CDC160]|uniref:helix-turn-helix transcriptional regulator n=1 Tax=Nocardia sp. CDC160 TaxID=3112166 RepID=UPI002DBCE5F6|nr:AAA family ATPase [Nocardia sp. CDC160]MEC3919173.1 AAA family ATPase [Nocardia sp. CDC160]